MSEQLVEQMNFKQLRRKVQELEDKLARMERTYEDLLYNLDFDNLEPNVRKPITATIKEVYPDGRTKESSIVQSAKEIRTEVRQVYAIREYSGDGDPGDRDHEYIWKNTDTNTYYVYHEKKDREGEWRETETNEIKTAFIQTDTGFSFDGTVEIKGDLITYGTISGDRISGGEITGVILNINTDAAVGNHLMLGENNANETKKIVWNGTSSIYNYQDHTGNPPTGLWISGSSVVLGASGGHVYVGINAPGNQVAVKSDLDEIWAAIRPN